MSSLDYIRWAREQRVERGLPRGEGDVLQTLATFASADGACEPSAKTIARSVGVSRQHVHKLLASLEKKRGLISTSRRVGRPAVRQLVIDAPHHEQMTLTDPPPEEGNTRSRVAPGRHSNVASSTVAPVASGGDTKEKEGLEEEERVREQRPALAAIAPALMDVLAVLGDAPGLLVEDLAINSVLLAFPETSGHDHLAAARVVHMWACEGGLDCLVANRLLYRELVKQGERRLRAEARASRTPPATAGGGREGKREKPWSGALRRAREAAGG